MRYFHNFEINYARPIFAHTVTQKYITAMRENTPSHVHYVHDATKDCHVPFIAAITAFHIYLQPLQCRHGVLAYGVYMQVPCSM